MLLTNSGNLGSIGPTWPPTRSTADRIKGIYPRILETQTQVNELMDNIRAAEDTIIATRVSIRGFVNRCMVRGLANNECGLNLEAIIPVDHQFGREIDLVYLGKNAPWRTPNSQLLREMISPYFSANHFKLAPEQLINNIKSSGYEFERLDAKISKADLEALVELYHTAFSVYMIPITAQTLADLLTDSKNYFLVYRHEGVIVSSMIAEHSNLLVDKKELDLFELSDFATSPTHRGKSLMTALQIDAIRMIVDNYGTQSSLIYAEDRAPHKPAVISSIRAGLVPLGALPAHITIAGSKFDKETFDEGIRDSDGNPYETLIPMAYLPAETVKSRSEAATTIYI